MRNFWGFETIAGLTGPCLYAQPPGPPRRPPPYFRRPRRARPDPRLPVRPPHPLHPPPQPPALPRSPASAGRPPPRPHRSRLPRASAPARSVADACARQPWAAVGPPRMQALRTSRQTSRHLTGVALHRGRASGAWTSAWVREGWRGGHQRLARPRRSSP